MKLLTDLAGAGIITNKDADQLGLLIQDKISWPDSILTTLYDFFQQRVTKQPPANWNFVTITPPPKVVSQDPSSDLLTKANAPAETDSPSAAKINASITANKAFLEILLHHNLITEMVYHKFKATDYAEFAGDLYYVLHLIRELAAYYKNFSTEKQLEFADKLGRRNASLAGGILQEDEKDKLLEDIRQNKLDNYLDFFRYSYCCAAVNLKLSEGQPDQLLEKLAQVVNELSYAGFSIASIKMEETNFKGQPAYDNKQITIYLSTGSKTHTRTYTFTQNEGWAPNKDYLLIDNFLELINTLLADFNISYRMTSINSRLRNSLFQNTGNEYIICRVEEHNRHIFEFSEMRDKSLHHNPSLNYYLPMSYAHIDYAISHFRTCGLLENLNEQQIINAIHNRTYKFPGDLLAVFPGVTAMVNRDIRAGQKPYQDFLESLNLISKGVLNFKEITDGTPALLNFQDTYPVEVSFTIDQEKHMIPLDSQNSEFNDQLLFYVVQEIIRKHYPAYRLVQMINNTPDTDYYIFLTTEQSAYLAQMKLMASINRY